MFLIYGYNDSFCTVNIEPFQVDNWQKDKIQKVEAELERAFQYEDRCTNATKQCSQLSSDDTMDKAQKKRKIQSIKSSVVSADGGYALNYGDSKHLAKYINALTTTVSIQYPSEMAMDRISGYGDMVKNVATSRLSVPVLDLKAPIKGRESKNGYKVNLKWTVSQPLAAHNFIIRCLTMESAPNDHRDDEKQNDSGDVQWKSLLFRMKDGDAKRSLFETKDIESVFLFEKRYKFRIEYHVSDPVNLLIGSNEQGIEVRDEPPQGNRAELIELG